VAATVLSAHYYIECNTAIGPTLRDLRLPPQSR
jgi:hypothetical protein